MASEELGGFVVVASDRRVGEQATSRSVMVLARRMIVFTSDPFVRTGRRSADLEEFDFAPSEACF